MAVGSHNGVRKKGRSSHDQSPEKLGITPLARSGVQWRRGDGVDVDVGFDEFLGYRHRQRFFGVRVRICIGLLIIINLRRHYDNLDGKSYKLGRRHDHRPVRRLYKHG